MTIGAREIETATRLFSEGWSSDDPYAPTRFMTDDVVMRDIAKHEAIAERWRHVAGRMKLPVEQIFVNDDGIVVLWFVYVRIVEGEHTGKYAMGEGTSRLEFRDGLVSLEIDYWHGRQGMCDDWEAHFAARQALSTYDRGRVSGYWVPEGP